jgi:restriction system protein
MSDALRNSTGSIGTVSNITKFSKEIEDFIAGNPKPILVTTDQSIEDPSEFALEKHLEDFLVRNWKQTELGKQYDIYEEDGELAGQQYPSDTGPIDILAISKDKKTLLVVELKKGRVSDTVVGQVQRYMGFVKEELAENGQDVKGVIIGLEDDIRIKRALSVAKNIDFFRYQVSFKLFKGN